MKNYLAEFIGTYFFVTVIGMVTAAGSGGAVGPIAIGFALAAMVYATAHISGGHLNPAVTLAVALRGKAHWSSLPGYWIAQMAGAVGAAFTAGYLAPDAHTPAAVFDMAKAFLAELIGTFVLAFVFLNSTTSNRTAGHSFYGFAVGATVLAALYAFGEISGGAFNPAVAVGVTVMGGISLANVWIHIIADLTGGTLAAIAFRFFNEGD